MKQRSPKRFDRLPERLAGDPDFVKWRIENHEDRLTALEQARPLRHPTTVQTPIGELPLVVVVFGMLLLLYMRPDLAYRLFHL